MVVLHLILLPNVTIKKGLTVEHPIAVTLQFSWISKGDFLGEKEDFQLFQIDTQIKFCLVTIQQLTMLMPNIFSKLVIYIS